MTNIEMTNIWNVDFCIQTGFIYDAQIKHFLRHLNKQNKKAYNV